MLVNLSFEVFTPIHIKRNSPLDSIQQSFPTTFHQTARIQRNDRTCVTTWYTISVNVWPKVGVWNVKSWVQWWFRSCLCLDRRRYPGDFADVCGWFGFRFMKKNSFCGAFSPMNIHIVPRILGVLKQMGWRSCIAFWYSGCFLGIEESWIKFGNFDHSFGSGLVFRDDIYLLVGVFKYVFVSPTWGNDPN